MPATKPTLFVFMGLIASGKSTLAQAFAEDRGLAVYNSDVVRKELAGQQSAATQSAAFAGGIYTPEFSRRTYDTLLHLAAQELDQGRSVVLDASYHKRAERHVLVDFCTSHDYAYLLIHCLVAEEETRRRLALRAQDPHAVSDGTWEIYLKQKEVFEYPTEIAPDHFLEIVTDRPVNELLTLLANPRIFAPFSS
jgi:hypothetical protein